MQIIDPSWWDQGAHRPNRSLPRWDRQIVTPGNIHHQAPDPGSYSDTDIGTKTQINGNPKICS
jgi:hypothetical protein